MKETICAVVVTYNRLNLLKECIGALRNQSRKLDEIIVVNNDSTDGTKEWLEEQKDLTKIHQENLGGAGGFHYGMKAAYEKGHDWIWLMDDDCLADNETLFKLIKNGLQCDIVYNCLSLDPISGELSFHLKEDKSNIFISFSMLRDRKEIYDGTFFNGTLISSKIIRSVGYPIKELFFRGDEVEYKLRINQKFKIHTIIDSVIFHPPELFYEANCLGLKHIYIKMSAKKKYFYHRNTLYIYRKYRNRNLLGIVKNAIFDSLFAFFKLREYKIAFYSLKGLFTGIYFIPNKK